MADIFWFRFTYPPCPDSITKRQELRKYQTLQYNQPYKNNKNTKAQSFKYAVTNTRSITRKTKNCTGFNPPNCSDVPGKSWDLFVTKGMINHKSILNNKHVIPQSGPSTWEYTKNYTDTS